MDLMLEDKVAMISGGSKGIGLNIARDLAADGCHVAISGRTQSDLDTAVKNIAAQERGRVISFCGDMNVKEDCEEFLAVAAREFDGVDILVNNVGGSDPKPLLETTDEDWLKVFEFNLFNAVRLSRLLIPEMKKRGGGSILNIASIAGRESGSAMTYNSSKAAMISFSKALAQQVAKDNIRVNSLAPGSVLFPGGVWERRIAESPDGLKSWSNSAMPLGRFGKPEEISAVATFMVSPRASLVHGACWNVDGCQSRSNI
jgi:3-oxoacyl-[acyl-carrier protein] reductase